MMNAFRPHSEGVNSRPGALARESSRRTRKDVEENRRFVLVQSHSILLGLASLWLRSSGSGIQQATLRADVIWFVFEMAVLFTGDHPQAGRPPTGSLR